MKRRSTREREEAAMRIRHAKSRLKRLQWKLSSHLPEDPYYKAMLAGFWEQFRIDKRIARGEL